jgi:hypothetical protein
MIRLEVIEMAEPGTGALDALKAYAAVSDAGQDDVLKMSLKRAFDVVQRYSDVALLPGTFRVCAEDHPTTVNVYMGGKVTDVKDDRGVAVSHHQRGRSVYVGTDRYVEVIFTTEVNPADYDRLLPVVLRYATAIYDGKDAKELNQILKEC